MHVRVCVCVYVWSCVCVYFFSDHDHIVNAGLSIQSRRIPCDDSDARSDHEKLLYKKLLIVTSPQ